MYTEQFIEGTRGQTICYNGERYTLEEDIHWDWPTYRDGTDKNVYAPIEPWALLESDRPGVWREAHWYLCSEAELDAWISAGNWSDKLAGILTFDDD